MVVFDALWVFATLWMRLYDVLKEGVKRRNKIQSGESRDGCKVAFWLLPGCFCDI